MSNFSQLEQRPPILVDITKIGLRTYNNGWFGDAAHADADAADVVGEHLVDHADALIRRTGSHTLPRVDFYDMLYDDDLFQIRDRLADQVQDGWIVLFTSITWPGGVNIVCTPDAEIEESLMSRGSPHGRNEFKVIASVYAPDRCKAFAQVRDRAASLATEAKNGGETNQWFMITEENAIASLKAAA